MDSQVKMPLQGLRVLDWTIWQAGPAGTAWFGDMGAEVIKIEEREKGDPSRSLLSVRGSSMVLGSEARTSYFEYNNRNKKSLAIDLRKEEGKEIIYRLVKESDVFVQNFRVGVAERMKMDYKTLSKYNPRLVYVSVSGFGPKGTFSERPTFDYLGLARSGFMTVVGGDDMPPIFVQGGLADQMAAIMMSHGVLTALYVREKTGRGQEVQVSLLSGMITLLEMTIASACLLGKQHPKQSRESASNPMWNHYQCKDGKWLAIACNPPDRFWPLVCNILGLEELEKDPRFENTAKREQNCRELIAIFDQLFATKPRDEWMRIMGESKEMLYTPLNYIVDVPNDPQVVANEYIQEFNHPSLGWIKMPTYNVKFSEMRCEMRLPAPLLGEHTEEILQEIGGYYKDEIARLKEEKII